MPGPFDDILNQGSPQQAAPQPTGNPFGDILSQAPAPQQAQGDHAPGTYNYMTGQETGGPSFAEEGSMFNDKLDQFNRGFEKYAIGGLQVINGMYRATAGNLPVIGNIISKDSLALDEKLKNYNQESQANYDAAKQRHPAPIISTLGNIGGATLASAPGIMAATTAGPASMLEMVGQGVAGGLTSGLMDQADNNTERTINGISGGLTGAFIILLFHLYDRSYIWTIQVCS